MFEITVILVQKAYLILSTDFRQPLILLHSLQFPNSPSENGRDSAKA
jgi:hypothetical protein